MRFSKLKFVAVGTVVVCFVLLVLTLNKPNGPHQKVVLASLVTGSVQSTKFTLPEANPKPAITVASTAPLIQSRLPQTGSAAPDDRFKYRIGNTTKSVGELLHNDRAILLENALLDTEQPITLAIPEHLRATNDPGSYIVQARRSIDDSFRGLLARSGATIVSYIPNNAYLVRGSAAVAKRLAASPQTQAVLPFEPYYKLKAGLLKLAVERELLPEGACLTVLLFEDTAGETIKQLEQLRCSVLVHDKSPFGPVVHIEPKEDWTAIAKLPGVHIIELSQPRVLANDLSRVRMYVASDTITNVNYMGLSGSNVFVAVADSGIDANHPDLHGKVVLGQGADGTDTNGHGTHVAGIIISSGAHGPQGTNVSGSVDGASFRGLAPAAKVYALPVNMSARPIASEGVPAVSDASLQQAAAKTNALISVNAWNYSGNNSYSIASASYDAAVRDALPGMSGPQPVLFVFSAGNAGNGSDNGLSGNPDSILAPATAKNVITVGAIEQPRYITNVVEQVTGGTTNRTTPWLGMTDSAIEVAPFSSRGNVGIGYEGDAGRFKPDVVAPGTFVLSTRSTYWSKNAYYDPRVYHTTKYTDQFTDANSLNFISVFLPSNAVEVMVEVVPNRSSPVPFPAMPIYVWRGTDPRVDSPIGPYANRVIAPGDLGLNPLGTFWWFGISNATSQTVFYDVVTRVATTEFEGYFNALSNLNESVGPYYRFESGTSMAAANAAGVLALIQEFFQKFGITNSPALMKALLINGARSVNPVYDFQVRPPINYQGWGLVNLQTTLHPGLTNPAPIFKFDRPEACSIKLLDQNPTNALATGQSLTWKLEVVGTNAVDLPLRVTLVWTDPAGNPAASIKLVNDLDLIVTNLDTTNVYFGNNISAGGLFTMPWDGVSPITNDTVNNVENVYIAPPLGTNYSITVVARRINVNAVTTQTNNVLQDFALVISCGDGEVADAIKIGDSAKPKFNSPSAIEVTYVTNTFQDATTVGALLLHQRAGASFQLLGTNTIPLGQNSYWATNSVVTLGVTNQWHFYVVTNTQNYTNAAFVTFLPPTLGVARGGVYSVDPEQEATREEADIDMFVARGHNNWAITNLDPVVLQNADKAVSRGGTELVVYSNAQPGEVFYIGVKAEDQMAAEYGFLAVFSLLPFSESTEDGVRVRFFPLPTVIPDGDNALPGVANVFGICVHQVNIRRAIVQSEFLHQNFGDLVGNLSHNRRFAVLNNHYNSLLPPPGPYGFVYEDNGEGVAGPLFPGQNIIFTGADSPGSLRNFVGEEGIGLWLFRVIDNHLTQTGAVTGFALLLEPQDLTKGMVATVEPHAWKYFSVDVPPEATNLTVILTFLSNSVGPLDLYIRRDAFPNPTEYDKCLLGIVAPGGSLSIGKADSPPLNAGRYYIGVYNPTTTPQTFELKVVIGLDLEGTKPTIFALTNAIPIFDDAMLTSSIPVNVNRKVSRVEVALAVEHPRVSDLAFTLVSPQGTRVLLFENRGGGTTNGLYGGSVFVTNTVTFPGFAGTTGQLSLVGSSAIVSNGILRLTPSAPSQMGTAWLWDRYFCAFGFETEFRFRISELGGQNGGDGITFSIQNNSPLALMWGGQWTDISNHACVMFKTFHNWPGCTDYSRCDVSGNCVGIRTNGYYVAQSDLTPLGINLSDGAIHKARISFNGQKISVFLDNVPVLTDVNIPGMRPGIDDLGRGWVGFTSFTGAAWENHDILDWKFTSFVPTPTYVVFTENTRKAYVPVKYAAPPFVGVSSNINLDDFESVASSDYVAGTTFGNWRILSNQVSVVSDQTNAYQGNKFLALANGVISNALPTIAGRTYILSFAYRGPGIAGMWRAEGSPSDSIAENHPTNVVAIGYRTGMVGLAFGFDGSNSLITIPPSTNLAVQSLTFDAWIFPTNSQFEPILEYGCAGELSPLHFWINGWGTNTIPGMLYMNLRPANPELRSAGGVVPINAWSHVACTVDSGAGVGHLYHNGTRVASCSLPVSLNTSTFTPLSIGYRDVASLEPLRGRRFAGLLDEVSVYNRALSASEVRAIYQRGSAGKFDVTGNFPDNLAAARVVVGTRTNVIYGKNSAWQLHTTTFVATQTGMPLEIFGLQPGMLLDAFTLLEVAPEAYYLPEESLEAFKGENAYGEWKLEVWDTRMDASNPPPAILSWQLRFLFETAVPPTIALTHAVPVTSTVGTNEIQYFYVDVPRWARAVTNSIRNATGPVNLWFNQNGLPAGTGGPGDHLLLANVTDGTFTLTSNSAPQLASGQRYYLGVKNTGAHPVTFTIMVEFDVITLTNGVPFRVVEDAYYRGRMYQFDASSNATALAFILTNLSGNVDLAVNSNLPLPTMSRYHYGSFLPGNLDELVAVFTNSTPVRAGPGRWYAGVFNMDTADVAYTIVAIELTNPIPPVITLTNTIPYANTNSAGAFPIDYYRFIVSQNAVRAQFEINGPSDDMALVVRKGFPPLPDLDIYHYLSDNPGTNDELIVVFDSSQPVPLTMGQWFLGAVNKAGVPVTYSIKATEWTEHGTNIVIKPELRPDRFCLSWNSLPGAHYVVEGTPSMPPPFWVDVSPTITATAPQTTWCVPLPSPYHFFRVREGLAIVHPPIELTHGITTSSTVGAHQTRYFFVDAPGWATAATNVLITASAPVNLLFNQSRLPSSSGAPGDFTLLNGVYSGAFTLRTNSVPPLVPGQRYYLGVHNPSASEVTFSIRVEFDITTLTNGIPVTGVLGTNAGRMFQFNVSSNALLASFAVTNLTGNAELVVRKGLPLPSVTNYHYGSFAPGINDELVVVSSNSAPVPLSPGRWYLYVYNADVANVCYTLVATEITTLPGVITLTNGIGYHATNAAGGLATDYYRFVVSSNGVRAQFEINGATGPMALAVRRGYPPLPSLTNYHYLSDNPGRNDELIVVFDSSVPVALQPGEWYLTAVNLSGVPVSYTVKATEWAERGTNVLIGRYEIWPDRLCITWNSLAGVHYVVEGTVTLPAPYWTNVSPTITATGTQTTWCVSLPSPYRFFRVREGIVITQQPALIAIERIRRTPSGIELGWQAQPGTRFQVEWTGNLSAPAWGRFTNVVTSATGNFEFTDDGSQTGGLGPTRFYRLVVLE